MLSFISATQIVQWHNKINVLLSKDLLTARISALEDFNKQVQPIDKQLQHLFVPPTIAWQEVTYADAHITTEKRDDTIFVGDMREFTTSFAQHAEKYLSMEHKKNKSQLFVDTCWNSFLVVFVPSDIRDAEIMFPEISAQFLVQKVLIIVQTGAQVTMRMSRAGAINIQAITCIVEDNAHLHIFAHDEKIVHGIVDYTFLLGARSGLHLFSDNSAAQTMHVSVQVIMQGRGAQATCRGLYILDEQQQMVVNSQQEHGAAETTTDIVFKGILSGQARAFFKGTIVVTEQGKKSNAVLYNKNILASTQARVVSMPQLEVAMNDVQCKHGSAISHVDKHQMLYLQSRGLDAQSAQTLLLASFVSDCIDLAYVPHVQKKLQAIVQEV